MRNSSKIIFIICSILLTSGICLRLALPSSTPLRLTQPPSSQSILLLPLDSRPVCSTMVQKLGALAGLNVILPPKAYLDNYRTPSDRQKLLQWLQTNQPKYDYSIISADNLLHGGLLAARMNTATPEEEDALLLQLQQLTPTKQQAIFSVIPRLLVSDQLLPDRWYQYQLMRYSQLADMVRITGSFALTQELQQMLDQGYKVALIDSSANFEAEELLLPQLLAHNVQINRLAAYAAWNTFSNSSGTALAQGLLFCGRLRQLQAAGADTELLAALYAANLNFTAERILEDYYYQKLVHPKLRQTLEAFGTDPVELDSEAKTATEQYIQGKLSLQAYKLLHDNLGRTPFYQQNGQSYYLRDLSVGAKLPWARIFEVELQVWTDTGVKTE